MSLSEIALKEQKDLKTKWISRFILINFLFSRSVGDNVTDEITDDELDWWELGIVGKTFAPLITLEPDPLQVIIRLHKICKNGY